MTIEVCHAHAAARRTTLLILAVVLLGAPTLAACSTAGPTQPPTAASAMDTAAAIPTPIATANLYPALVSADELEQRFGVRLTLLAVTAANGLIDLRFRIVDAAKAAALFDPETLPAIIARDGTVAIRPPTPPDPVDLTDGQVYFFLYPNTAGAVKPGSQVILSFGDVGMEAQVAP
jgi:hypothetical protein